jgi:sulfur carrier protein
MKATINGEELELREGMTVGQLLELLGAQRSGIAVACNEAVIRRSHYDEHRLQPGDRIEIIKAVAGG